MIRETILPAPCASLQLQQLLSSISSKPSSINNKSANTGYSAACSHRKHHAPGDLPCPHLFQNCICFAQWTRGHLAVQFSRGGHGQGFAQVFSRADGGGFDVHF